MNQKVINAEIKYHHYEAIRNDDILCSYMAYIIICF